MPKEAITDETDMRRFSNALRLRAEKRIDAITDELVAGERDLKSWQREMLTILRDTNVDQYLLSQGGKVSEEQLLKFRKDKIRTEILKQRGHLADFASVIQAASDNGKSLEFARARARMYGRSTQAMFWKGYVPVELPQVPRDGQTKCRTNCKCRLNIQRETDADGNLIAVLVYWRMGIAEHCKDCRDLQREWNPLRIEVSETSESSTRQAVDLLVLAQTDLMPLRQEFYAMYGVVDEVERV